MKCPECGCEESKVIDSRPSDNRVRRRRECLTCTARFTTYEMVENTPLMVIKKDKAMEPFDRSKLLNGLLRATAKRNVNLEDLENIIEKIVSELKNKLQREVTSDKIGEIAMQQLKEIDHVAYIRFASVYRDFNDIDSFMNIITELSVNQMEELNPKLPTKKFE